MNKRQIIGAVLVVGLTLAFVAVSFGVYLSKGKSPFWISKKLKIGAWLLTLSALGNQACDPFITTCYDPAPQNYISMDSVDYSGVINVDLNISHKLTGVLYDRNGSEYSFVVCDTLGTDTVQVGEIKPADGAFDGNTEEVVIELDTTLQTKIYRLRLYQGNSSNPSYPISEFTLNLKNED